MKALGYARCSTEGQASEGVTMENQRERITAYARFQGFELVDVIEDAGVSGGTNRARAGFLKLLDRAQKGDIQVIVLYSLDRLSRDMLTLLALEKLLDELDVEVHTVDGALSTASPDGWLSFAMKSLLAEHERRQIKFRTKRALQHKKAHGQVVGSIPYGYERDGEALREVPAEQEVIRRANDMYEQGARLVDIVGFLNQDGTLTRNGRPWTPQQVKRIVNGYQDRFRKGTTKVSIAARKFIEAVA